MTEERIKPFKFAWLCELLEELDRSRFRKALACPRTVNADCQVIISWFNRYHPRIAKDATERLAFLSCLFPERRPDRVYYLQDKRLAYIFGRSLCLSSNRLKELNAWHQRDGVDFASCVEKVMAQAEFDVPSPRKEVTLQEIDAVLNRIAERTSRGQNRTDAKDPAIDHLLRQLLIRLRSYEAKWLVRMILKSFSPVRIPEYTALHQFHFLLPDILAVQNSMEGAIMTLGGARISQIPPRPAKDVEYVLKTLVGDELVPRIGIMVRRQPYDKARSIKNCCDMAASREWSVERKYDGEYCQIHIDLSKGGNCIQIFSKSGKDSTDDRVRLHGAIKDSLGIGTSSCRISQRCILEGELLVWSESKQAIQPFHKIRKHVKHGGRWLGNDADSPAALDEHLMIMFLDLLLLDETVYIKESHNARRQNLAQLVTRRTGRSDIGARGKINFKFRRAAGQIRKVFAESITRGWEGLVLKACEDPYFSLSRAPRCIKLKKDYIAGLGDTADLLIIGGSHDNRVEQEIALGKLRWTSFYLACLQNVEEVRRFNEMPKLRIVDMIGHHSIQKEDILLLNQRGQYVQTAFESVTPTMEVTVLRTDIPQPTELFNTAFVAEIMGAGFERPQNATFSVIRFPRLVKIHSDRAIEDTVGFDELQEMAAESMASPTNHDSQVERDWIEKLSKKDSKSKYIVDKSQSTSPSTLPSLAISASFFSSESTSSTSPVLVPVGSLDITSQENQNSSISLRASNIVPKSALEGGDSPRKRKIELPHNLHTAVCPPTGRQLFSNAGVYSRATVRSVDTDYVANRKSLSPARNLSDQVPRTSIPAVRSFLLKTPPWCMQSDHENHTSNRTFMPAIVTGSSLTEDCRLRGDNRSNSSTIPPQNCGKPLSEIVNSAQHRRTNSLGKHRGTTKTHQHDTALVIREDAERTRGLTLLLQQPFSPSPEVLCQSTTPSLLLKRPASSVEARKNTIIVNMESTAEANQPALMLQASDSDSANFKAVQTEMNLQPEPQTSPSSEASTIIEPGTYLPPNISAHPLLVLDLTSSSPSSSGAIDGPLPPEDVQLLQKCPTAFTYSAAFFVRSILQPNSSDSPLTSPPHATNIVLLDCSQPTRSIAEAIRDLGVQLVREGRSWRRAPSTTTTAEEEEEEEEAAAPIRTGAVIFMDWEMLKSWDRASADFVALGKTWWCGTLKWRLDEAVGGAARMHVRTEWSWKETFTVTLRKVA